jgi:hypothetical protein
MLVVLKTAAVRFGTMLETFDLIYILTSTQIDKIEFGVRHTKVGVKFGLGLDS